MSSLIQGVISYLVVSICPVSSGLSQFSQFLSCFWWPRQSSGVLVRCSVNAPPFGFFLCSWSWTGVIGYGRIPWRWPALLVTLYQGLSWYQPWNITHQWIVTVFVCFLYCKVTLFPFLTLFGRKSPSLAHPDMEGLISTCWRGVYLYVFNGILL